jgi:hypothetical protein
VVRGRVLTGRRPAACEQSITGHWPPATGHLDKRKEAGAARAAAAFARTRARERDGEAHAEMCMGSHRKTWSFGALLAVFAVAVAVAVGSVPTKAIETVTGQWVAEFTDEPGVVFFSIQRKRNGWGHMNSSFEIQASSLQG